MKIVCMFTLALSVFGFIAATVHSRGISANSLFWLVIGMLSYWEIKRGKILSSAMSKQQMLELLRDLQKELANALNSLGGKQGNGLYDNYQVYITGYVNRAAEGFIFLRTAGCVDSSKLLVRPAIEVAIRLLAIRIQPDILYRIAFSEHQSDATWVKALAKQAGETFDETAFQKQWDDFKTKFTEQFPQYPPVDKPIGIEALAQKAGIGGYYNSHYRTYCRHAHGALRGGSLNEVTDHEDIRAMCWATFAALEDLPRLGAATPNLDALRIRMETLSKEP